MIKLPTRPPRNEEDLRILATIKGADGKTIVADVLTKVFLPEKLGEMPYFQFLPTALQYKALIPHSFVNLHSKQKHGHETELTAEDVMLRNKSQRGVINPAFTLDGIPWRLIKKDPLGGTPSYSPAVTCRISPNQFLRPRHSRERHLDGTVLVARSP